MVIAATKATAVCQDSRGKSDDKSHLYWAKGTGFGTGSTAQSWNVEQALLRQRSEEEHVTVLLQVKLINMHFYANNLLKCVHLQFICKPLSACCTQFKAEIKIVKN